jgi:hypothetical protein
MKTCNTCKETKPFKEFYKQTPTKRNKEGYQGKCKKCVNAYYLENKEKTLKYVKEWSLKTNHHKKYYQKNKPKIKQQNKENYRRRYNEDIEFRMLEILRKRIYTCLVKGIKNPSRHRKSSIEELGCSPKEWCVYLEKQFNGKMNWDNYGTYWEVDHIKQLNQGGSFHYTNTRPLSIPENRQRKKK